MTESRPWRLDVSWSGADRAGLLTLVLAAGAALAIAAAHGWSEAGDAEHFDAAKAASAAQKVDPNTAGPALLQLLPDVGPVTAAALIEYRTKAAARLPEGQPVFKTATDLCSVPYLGMATVEEFRSYLVFPPRGPRPESQPGGK